MSERIPLKDLLLNSAKVEQIACCSLDARGSAPSGQRPGWAARSRVTGQSTRVGGVLVILRRPPRTADRTSSRLTSPSWLGTRRRLEDPGGKARLGVPLVGCPSDDQIERPLVRRW